MKKKFNFLLVILWLPCLLYQSFPQVNVNLMLMRPCLFRQMLNLIISARIMRINLFC